MRERNHLEDVVGGYERLDREFTDNIELAQMAEAEKDDAMLAESERALKAVADELHKLEIESLLSGEADANDCFLEINSGAGGTESQDWAEILMRMYVRWAGKRGFKTEIGRASCRERV